jgi:hypothetical protein
MTVSADTAEDAYAVPYYIGTLSTLGYYVLFIQHYEGSAVQLINVRTGWSTYLRDMPILSPDRRRFVVAEQNPERYDPQRLQIWHVERDTLRLEWGLTPKGDAWIPDSVRWLSSSSFRFVRGAPPEGPEQWTPDTAKLNTRKAWTTARP